MTLDCILLAALSYHRPAGLTALLDGIARLVGAPGTAFEVLIVDNSAHGSAREAVMAHARGFPFALHYLHEPKRGLSPARNAALNWALSARFSALGFVDDDEVPDPRWLVEHLRVLRAGADVSVGAVKPAFEKRPKRWLTDGGFLSFSPVGRVDGHTSNVLFLLDQVRKAGAQFDAAFSLTGGEDTAFFDQLRRKGARIQGAPRAIVTEAIVEARSTLSWLWRRWRRTGLTNGMIRLTGRDTVRARAICALGGVLRLLIGGALAIVSAPMMLIGRSDVPARGLRILARGLGFIDSALGRRIEEYRVMTR